MVAAAASSDPDERWNDACCIVVQIMPGWTLLMRIFSLAVSIATDLVKSRTPALLAE